MDSRYVMWETMMSYSYLTVRNVLFIFDSEEEIEKILEGEPWSFNKHLVMIQRYDHTILVRDLVFDRVSLWVQVHDIPI